MPAIQSDQARTAIAKLAIRCQRGTRPLSLTLSGYFAFCILHFAFSFTALAQSVYATPYTFATLAGLAGTSGGNDGTGSAARFLFPYGVAVDNAGDIYVTDYGANTIREVTSTGEVTTLAGLAGNEGSADGTGSNARFEGPAGIALDSAGNLYVADAANSTIRMVTPAGVVTPPAGIRGHPGSANGLGGVAQFNLPYGVALDSSNNLYVTDLNNHTLRKMTDGVVNTLAGLAGSPGSADGTGSAARFFSPFGVAVDSAGIVYVSDAYNHTIRKVTPAGVVTTLAGLAGTSGFADGTGSAARFHNPGLLAVDGAGNVYLPDRNNFAIRKVTPAGVVTTLAGLPGTSGCADGTGSAALFYYPMGLAVDGAGNVYVGDTQNHTIRIGYQAALIGSSGSGFGFNGGQFGFNLSGSPGQDVVIEASTDLLTWQPIWTNTFLTCSLSFADPQAGGCPQRFYRTMAP